MQLFAHNNAKLFTLLVKDLVECGGSRGDLRVETSSGWK